MALGKVNHLQFHVTNVEKTVKYFTEKLGFKIVRRVKRPTGDMHIELASPAGDLEFHFVPVTEESKNNPDRPYLEHLAFEVTDLRKECEELKSKEVPFHYGPEFEQHTGRSLAGIRDAEGRGWIQLHEVKPKK